MIFLPLEPTLNMIPIILLLILSLTINSTILWLLLKREVKFWQMVKLTSVAVTLNKLLLTGSGYLAMSWKMKSYLFPLSRSFIAFTLLELTTVLPWLIFGIYFGAKVAIKIHPFLIIVLFLILFLIYKRKGKSVFLKDTWIYLRDSSIEVLKVLPLSLLGIILHTLYYSFILKIFKVNFLLSEIFKIVAISFTFGYLSPAPSGLGFKEGSLIFLLMQHNLSLKDSFLIAITERFISTVFFATLGVCFGFGIIKEMVLRRMRIKPKRSITTIC